jgi:hypothetical protein
MAPIPQELIEKALPNQTYPTQLIKKKKKINIYIYPTQVLKKINRADKRRN